jgi:O-antigen/teichoic acid export membrane protein
VARNKSLTQKYIGNLLSWKLILGVLVYGAMLITVNLFYDYAPEIRYAIYWLTISAILKSLKYTFRLFFQAHNYYAYDSALVLMERVGLLSICLIVLYVYRSIYPFIISFTLVRAADLLITMAVLNFKIAKIRFQFDKNFIFKLQKEAIPLGMFFIILTLFSYIDIVMLSKMIKGFNATGLYGAAFRIYEGFTILPTIIFLVALPRLSELYFTDKKRHYDLAVRVVKYMFIMAIPVVVYGFFYADFLLQKLYATVPEFFVAKFALQTLFIGIIFQYPNWMLNTILISVDKQYIIMWIGTSGLIFKILLNLIVIPHYGYEGAAVATVCGEGFIFVLSSLYLAWHRLRIPVLKVSSRPLLIMGIMAGLFWLGIPHFALIPLGLLMLPIWIGLLFLFRIFDRVELNGLKTSVLNWIR